MCVVEKGVSSSHNEIAHEYHYPEFKTKVHRGVEYVSAYHSHHHYREERQQDEGKSEA